MSRSVSAASLPPMPLEALAADWTREEICAAIALLLGRLAQPPAPPPQDEVLDTEAAWKLAGEASRDTFLRRLCWRRALAGVRRRPLKWRKVELLKIKAEQAVRAAIESGAESR